MTLPAKPGPYQVAIPLIVYDLDGQVSIGLDAGRSWRLGNAPASLARSPPFATVTSPTLAHGCLTFHSWSTARCNRMTYIGPESRMVEVGRPYSSIALTVETYA